MEEIWKEHFDGYYAISNFGNVISADREVPDRYGGSYFKEGRILSNILDGSGYLNVKILTPTYRKREKVHRLVALLFIDNPLLKPQVNHIDGNKQNNIYTNLEWCTNSENQKHAFELDLNHKGTNHAYAILNETLVMRIRGLIAEGVSDVLIGKRLGIHRSTIRSIRIGKTWKHVS